MVQGNDAIKNATYDPRLRLPRDSPSPIWGATISPHVDQSDFSNTALGRGISEGKTTPYSKGLTRGAALKLVTGAAAADPKGQAPSDRWPAGHPRPAARRPHRHRRHHRARHRARGRHRDGPSRPSRPKSSTPPSPSSATTRSGRRNWPRKSPRKWPRTMPRPASRHSPASSGRPSSPTRPPRKPPKPRPARRTAGKGRHAGLHRQHVHRMPELHDGAERHV